MSHWEQQLSPDERHELNSSLALTELEAKRVKRKLFMRVWVKNNPDKIAASNAARMKKYHADQNIRDSAIIKSKVWKKKNPDKVSASYHRNKHKRASRVSATCAAYYQKNRDKCLEASKAYNKRRREIDPLFRVMASSRTRMSGLLRGTNKSARAQTLMGCTRETFLAHIESLLKDGMNWCNYGPKGWHIDHILPCSSFDLTQADQMSKCFHYTNLQPLWWKDNLRKGAKVILIKSP